MPFINRPKEKLNCKERLHYSLSNRNKKCFISLQDITFHLILQTEKIMSSISSTK